MHVQRITSYNTHTLHTHYTHKLPTDKIIRILKYALLQPIRNGKIIFVVSVMTPIPLLISINFILCY